MFLLFMALALGLLNYYLWRRLVRATTTSRRARATGAVVLGALFVMMMTAMALVRLDPLGYAWIAWPGYLWLALGFYLAVILVVLEIPRLILNRWWRRDTPEPVTASLPASPAEDGVAVAVAEREFEEAATEATAKRPVDNGRRLFIARSMAVATGLAATGIVGYGARTALGGPQVRTVPVTLAKLDPALSGYRIAVVSDIHLGPLLGRSHTERIVRTINGLQPDLVAVVGDLVDGTVAQLGEAAAPLKDLVSKDGAFFVTGNHEYYSGHLEWISELGRLGMDVLRNERLTIARNGAAFDLAGVNDHTGGQMDDAPDYDKALGGRDERNPVVLLAHQPVQVREAAARGVDLQLSGHTHGGQMFPFSLAVPIQQPVTSGLATVDGTQVYVSNGAGFWGPPVRVGAPPEVTLVELRHNSALG
ncbi:metallophosphoesterase [Actinosynnema pretiosum subsp. pretiosum]|uniref:Metallophosphoesterase n=2 Tax=Actinosynnema TaxID=40566 RepID=C6WC80_ACTMD|nr:metallophosphoesterase [Actinosynnema mirum]ACU39468.1 metallophosphoesterase [Actinosynnema mirum DSM 43827]AXX32974.1 membrane protein [Actinosynnema pretiosum subsp. pretiosum]QUF03166.1 metallophosphoesterase [Actinosynnema pretiosum subsp. pretiosum]